MTSSGHFRAALTTRTGNDKLTSGSEIRLPQAVRSGVNAASAVIRPAAGSRSATSIRSANGNSPCRRTARHGGHGERVRHGRKREHGQPHVPPRRPFARGDARPRGIGLDRLGGRCFRDRHAGNGFSTKQARPREAIFRPAFRSRSRRPCGRQTRASRAWPRRRSQEMRHRRQDAESAVRSVGR